MRGRGRVSLSVCWGDRMAPVPRYLDRQDCGAGRDCVVLTSDRRIMPCSFHHLSVPVRTAADVLAVALGADYDFEATPGFEEGGSEYYSVEGAERLRDVLPSFDSGTILIGILAALAAGLAVSALHAWLCISLRADQIISGTIVNIVAVGVTGYLDLLLSAKDLPTAGKLSVYRPPKELIELPVVGWLFKMFLQQGPITMSVIVLAVGIAVLYERRARTLTAAFLGVYVGVALLLTVAMTALGGTA